MILKLYRFLTLLLSPVIDIYLKKRMASGKEDSERFDERLGYAAFSRPKGSLVWIHAASIGESMSVLPLINKLCEKYENISVLLTTGTVTSAKIIESRLPKNAFHQYIPIDRITCVNRFLRHWRPNLALWVESELWPNLITETRRYCKLILLNARMSGDSYRKWQKYSNFCKNVLDSFSLCLPQSGKDEERFYDLGMKNIKHIGNLKLGSPALPADPKIMGEMVNMVGERPVWVAASTHEGEEKIIAEIHKELKEENPQLLTIIIPRHPERVAEIKKIISDKKLEVAIRSKEQIISESTDIYIADTFGELGVFYRFSPIVFIGGSLIPHGGQNPLESARLDCAILMGPFMDNFTELAEELEQNDAAIAVSGKEELRKNLEELLLNPERRESLASNALKIVESKQEILDKYVAELAPFIEKFAKAKSDN